MTVKGMVLRKIACDLDAADAFEAILTPDYDDVHWNHFHLSAFHAAQRSRLRPRGTALLEVSLSELTLWAMARPRQQDPRLRRWDRAAFAPWPSEYAAVRHQLGIPDPPALFVETLWGAPEPGLLSPLKETAGEFWNRIRPDVVELLRQVFRE
jgi:hypothetical protein